MKYNIGDLIIFNDTFVEQIYTGIIIDIVKDKIWHGGGYYVIHWEYPEYFNGIKDNRAAFALMKSWVSNKEAVIYPVVK